MTREEAEKAAILLKQIKEYESADTGIRKLHKQASSGDKESLDKLTNIALELSKSMARELENKLLAITFITFLILISMMFVQFIFFERFLPLGILFVLWGLIMGIYCPLLVVYVYVNRRLLVRSCQTTSTVSLLVHGGFV